jgi:predicted peptidase
MRASRLVGLICPLLVAGCVLATSLSETELVMLPASDSVSVSRAMAEINAGSPASLFVPGTYRSGGRMLPYRLLSPADSDAKATYPLVLVLHGSGALGTDNTSQLGAFARAWALPEMRAAYPAYVVVPQFDDRSSTYITDERDSLPASEGTDRLRLAAALVDQLIATRRVDRNRVYAVGFSIGGSAAWDLAAERPGFFAAIVPFAGVPPRRSLAPTISRTPTYIVHGTADTENPITADRAMFAKLSVASSSNVHFRQYVGLGHLVPPEFMTDTAWRSWMFAQHRGR